MKTFVVFLATLAVVLASTRCSPSAHKVEETTCYHPMVAPMPFPLQKGDYFDRTGALIAERAGSAYVLRGALCVTKRSNINE